jgi:hypothetical protein
VSSLEIDTKDSTAAGNKQNSQTDQDKAGPKKPKGRTLRDVESDRPFRPAEVELIKACAAGNAVRIGKSVPSEVADQNVIRADLIRFLALGGDDLTPVHERGLMVSGAWIDGSIDLSGCEVTRALNITDSKIAGSVHLMDAKIANLNLGGTTVDQIRGDRLKCSSSILLRYGFHSLGIVTFPRASITGDLELTGGKVDGSQIRDGAERQAIFCPRIEIGGGVLALDRIMKPAFRAQGIVDFSGARISGDFRFLNATFVADKTVALICDLAQVGGVSILEECSFVGLIRMLGMQIKGDMHLIACSFVSSEVTMTRIRVDGRFVFREIEGSIGQLYLRGAKVDALVDDLESWEVTKNLVLDGFEYGRILDIGYTRAGAPVQFVSPVDAASRIAWLKLQRESDLGEDFKPQPWEQLAEVLAKMGHDDDARTVSIEKQRLKRNAWLIQSRANNDHFAKRFRLRWQVFGHFVYGMLSRYGYRPSLIVGWAFAAAVIFAGAFTLADRWGVMAPTDRAILGNAANDKCRPHQWTTCDELLGKYPPFNPVIYSFDLILPVIATRQVQDWAPLTTKPDGRIWRLGLSFWLLSRIANLFGWIAGLMFVATVAGLVKKD